MKIQRPIEIRIGTVAEVMTWYYSIMDSTTGKKPIKEIWSGNIVQNNTPPGLMVQPTLDLIVWCILVFNPDKPKLDA